MKILLACLVLLLLVLQYRFILGEGSITHVKSLQAQIVLQKKENQRLQSQNTRLVAEVDALRNGNDAIEAKAREELGLIKQDETFFLFVDESEQKDK